MIRLPSQLDTPAFLMSFPFTVDNRVPNNAWMEGERALPYHKPIAFRQWQALYKELSARGVVWLLPAEGDFQDRPFVADVACVMHHAPPFVAVSKLACEGRDGEEAAVRLFFASMGCTVCQSPFPWQGEADLKHITENVYIGGWGQRSTLIAFAWMRDAFGADIVTVELTAPKAYHLDALLFPLGGQKALVATSAFQSGDLRKIEQCVDIIEVPKHCVYDNWTNCVLIGDMVLHNPTSAESASELSTLLEKHGFWLRTIDLSEFDLSGAALSCLVMHLNDKNRQTDAERWRQADLVDRDNGWGDAQTRIRTAFSER